MLKIGDKAPLSVGSYEVGVGKVSLKDYLGKWLVVYFYPKDDTPGCTVEAKGFRDAHDDMEDLGVVVIGVSKDDDKSHEKFVGKHGLNFPLWSDPEHKLMDAFSVWGKRQFMGREYMGTSRSTFILDPKGKVAAVWEKVSPPGHAKEVLATLKELQATS